MKGKRLRGTTLGARVWISRLHYHRSITLNHPKSHPQPDKLWQLRGRCYKRFRKESNNLEQAPIGQSSQSNHAILIEFSEHQHSPEKNVCKQDSADHAGRPLCLPAGRGPTRTNLPDSRKNPASANHPTTPTNHRLGSANPDGPGSSRWWDGPPAAAGLVWDRDGPCLSGQWSGPPGPCRPAGCSLMLLVFVCPQCQAKPKSLFYNIRGRALFCPPAHVLQRIGVATEKPSTPNPKP